MLNPVASIAENTGTASSIKVADISVSDDALGSNQVSLSGTDAASFEIVAGNELHLRAGTELERIHPSHYQQKRPRGRHWAQQQQRLYHSKARILRKLERTGIEAD